LVALPQKTLLTRKLQRNQPDGLDNELDKGEDKRLGTNDTLKIATSNERGLGTKEIELDKELKKKEINIAIITEKKKLYETKDLENYVMVFMLWKRKKCE
jgi:hypothetical protein